MSISSRNDSAIKFLLQIVKEQHFQLVLDHYREKGMGVAIFEYIPSIEKTSNLKYTYISKLLDPDTFSCALEMMTDKEQLLQKINSATIIISINIPLDGSSSVGKSIGQNFLFDTEKMEFET